MSKRSFVKAIVSLEDYKDAVETYTGWCTRCRDFTSECVEPDARFYTCPECQSATVFGAEQALLEEFIDVDC